MNHLQTFGDKAAIALSLFCALHCLALPVALAIVPSLAAIPLGNEAFHKWLLLGVIPTSTIALTLGCKQHKTYSILAYGVVGILIMLMAALFGHDLVGEAGEITFTLMGAAFIAIGHWRNYQLCQAKVCECHD